jgi:ABC-2 type transport system ATP-binding protein
MIVATALTKRFGRLTAVDAVDFEVPRGQVVGFLGPNGAGKSTTIRMICGYTAPTSGSVTVNELDVQQHRRDVLKRLGYLPESAPLYTEMRVREYLKFRARMFGMGRRGRKRAIEQVLRRCWLTDVQRRPIEQLSKGYRQRVGLAAALLHDPPVLIFDEPTAGLDPAQIREVRSLIRELGGEHTVLLSSHILSEVEAVCDRVMIIAGGRIRAEGSMDELRTEATRTAQYIIETETRVEAEQLRELPFVAEVNKLDLEGGWQRFTITSKPDAPDLRERLGMALKRSQATTRELHRVAPSLEQLFVQVVTEAEKPAAAEREQRRPKDWRATTALKES